MQLVVLIPPVFDQLTTNLLALPPDVARLIYETLVLFLPCPAAIGYRRFQQGLLIRHLLTHRVAYGTVLRLLTMSVTAFVAFWVTDLDDTYLGALVLSAGVTIEAVASRLMTRDVVPVLLARECARARLDSLRLPSLINFYVPLALTSLLAMSIQPLVTFFMGQSWFALESLAVLPVIHGLTFIFRALGLSYIEVVVALIGDRREHFRSIRNFAVILALAAAGGLMTIAYTHLAFAWFRNVSGLTLTLTTFALLPLRILSVFPALSVTLAVQRALLVHADRTTPITSVTLMEVFTVAAPSLWESTCSGWLALLQPQQC